MSECSYSSLEKFPINDDLDFMRFLKKTEGGDDVTRMR